MDRDKDGKFGKKSIAKTSKFSAFRKRSKQTAKVAINPDELESDDSLTILVNINTQSGESQEEQDDLIDIMEPSGDEINEAIKELQKDEDEAEAKESNKGQVVAKKYELNRRPSSVIDKYTVETVEELAKAFGAASLVLQEENKSVLWFLLKQVRPGMDLSKVSLPTFILEPRSFLDKLSDYYFHCDILGKTILEDDPLARMKGVVKWYLSGFYKKPKGLKKPYNPVLGESFRCKWIQPNGSSTYYIAEQVSHHPPVSSFYVSNRQDGYVISASILAKSKFSGNSTSAILDGEATLLFLPRREAYTLNMPYALCKGILIGTLTMELGGNVTINCPTTGHSAELEFKLKGYLSRGDSSNAIAGKFKCGNEVLGTLEGHWDNKIIYKDHHKKHGKKHKDEDEVFWEVTDEVREGRLKRFTIPVEDQLEDESEKLWEKVSDAIIIDDQDTATAEKNLLEDKQRLEDKRRHSENIDWASKYFFFNQNTGIWRYKHEDIRPWEEKIDIVEFEEDYKLQTIRIKSGLESELEESAKGIKMSRRSLRMSIDDILEEIQHDMKDKEEKDKKHKKDHKKDKTSIFDHEHEHEHEHENEAEDHVVLQPKEGKTDLDESAKSISKKDVKSKAKLGKKGKKGSRIKSIVACCPKSTKHDTDED